MKKLTVIFLFLILAGLYFYQNFFKNEQEDNSPILQPNNAIIDAADQRPGPFVSINFASLSKPGYIVIQEDDRGKPGIVLGNSAVLPEGESRGIFVGLIRPSVNGEPLYAVMYNDGGDGIFSPSLDAPVKDEYGNIIFDRFLINRSAVITK